MSLETYGNYQLIKRLATGGMAQIFLARQTGLEGFEKLLVVKRILPHLGENEEFVRMFLDEARIAARLNHPNIVQIFNLGQQDDSFFIAMEYIHGEDVRRVWKRADAAGREFPIPLVCRVVMDACNGLDYAHKKADASGKPLNIVHRDISPQNILVTFEGGVKVVDFGIAKAADQATVTRSGVLKGKYSYMSPEQASGSKLDCRSDIFALGVVLYELLTGTRLFKRTTDLQTLKAVTDCQVIPPSQVNPRIPEDLDAVVMKALEKDVGRRYQEAVHLQLALEDWLVKNQKPSSSAHLAQFMQEIYSERLQREAVEGKVFVEEVESLSPKSSEGSPNSPASSKESTGQPRRAANGRSSPFLRAQQDTESTAADRPQGRSQASRVPEGQRVTQEPQPGRRSLEVRRETIAQTPRAISESRKFKLPDPSEQSMSMSVTETVRPMPRAPSWAWAMIGLVLVGGVAAFGVRHFLGPHDPTQGQVSPPSLLQKPLAIVAVESEPRGAEVVIAGQTVCTTPCDLPPRKAGHLALELKLSGYQSHSVEVDVPATGNLSVPMVRLERVAEKVDAPDASTSEPKLSAENPGESTPEHHVRKEHHRPKPPADDTESAKAPVTPMTPVSTGTGVLNFVILPIPNGWAKVSCNGQDFGEYPGTGAKKLPAGTYRCKFTNPDHGTVTRNVEVKPGDQPQVVKVSFASNDAP